MKLKNAIIGLSAVVIAGVTTAIVMNEPPKRVTIPKNNDGGLYKPKFANYKLNPGDTLVLEGDYAYINFDSLRGTAEKPIIIINKGIVRAGVNNHYGWIMTNSKYFKIVGIAVNGDYHPFKVGGPDSTKYIAQSFTFPTSDNFEVSGMELSNAQVGFFANPKKGGIYRNIKIHDNYIHNLNNPAESGRSEAFYIGQTDSSTMTSPGHFDGVEIYNNLLMGLFGDGIQVALTSNLNIHHNVIYGYGYANLIQQRTGIIVGGCSNGKVSDNRIENGTGAAIQVFGGGDVYLTNNAATNVASSLNEDGIYIDGKCRDLALKVYITGNSIVGKVNRDYLRDATKSVVLNQNNYFGTPKPVPVDTVAVPTKKVTGTIGITIYEDGTYLVK